MNPDHIRKTIREKRRGLTTDQQCCAAEQLAQRLCREEFFLRAERIAVYLANDGEIDPAQIIAAAFKLNKACFLPVIDPTTRNSLHFAQYRQGDSLHKNRFGIPEPKLDSAATLPVSELDLILVPLVAFDRNGNRIGMGGGFYDRTLAPCSEKLGPTLVGLAHQCQELDNISTQSWDIPLDNIATDKEIICARLK